ncbi:MAG: hypothetical protein J0I23_23005 [Rhizobiales bacterium]|nr:hypothetical protein [Hyphomicrobiales bacterium]
MEERFGKDPAHHELMKGVWTQRRSSPQQSPKICAATFWTRNGGVSFIHLGGKDDCIPPPKAVCPDLLIGVKSMAYVMRYNHFPD